MEFYNRPVKDSEERLQSLGGETKEHVEKPMTQTPPRRGGICKGRKTSIGRNGNDDDDSLTLWTADQ